MSNGRVLLAFKCLHNHFIHLKGESNQTNVPKLD